MSILIQRTRIVKHCHLGLRIKGIKGLLKRDHVNPNTAQENGTTPFCIVAWMRDEGVVNRLLERFSGNVDSNTEDKDSKRRLFWAIQEAKREV